MAEIYHRQFFIPGPAGRLQATVWTQPESERARMAAVVCHPHPLYGGTLHNKVVYRVARALHRWSVPVLRFNFRGAGMSEGTHDAGRGEREDVRAALDFLAATFSGVPLLLAGFSFGAAVGLRVGCADPRVAELIGLGLPANNSGLSFLTACRKPALFLQGGKDPYGSQENVRKLLDARPAPTRLVIVEDADHFFAGKLDEVEKAVNEWMEERHPELRPLQGTA